MRVFSCFFVLHTNQFDVPATGVLPTCTPRMPNMMKNVQQMRTMFPIGRRDDNNVCTTSFKPGARLITLQVINEHKILRYL